jgi:hypothetical protein
VLPRVLRLWTLPPYSGGLRRCHVPRSSGFGLSAQEGFGAAMCPAAPDLASLLRKALALPHVLQLWDPPPCLGGLRRCHVPRDSGPHLSAQEGSGTATCTVALCLRNNEKISWPRHVARFMCFQGTPACF